MKLKEENFKRVVSSATMLKKKRIEEALNDAREFVKSYFSQEVFIRNFRGAVCFENGGFKIKSFELIQRVQKGVEPYGIVYLATKKDKILGYSIYKGDGSKLGIRGFAPQPEGKDGFTFLRIMRSSEFLSEGSEAIDTAYETTQNNCLTSFIEIYVPEYIYILEFLPHIFKSENILGVEVNFNSKKGFKSSKKILSFPVRNIRDLREVKKAIFQILGGREYGRDIGSKK